MNCVVDGAREGRAFLSEDVDVDDAWLLTGRFSAHWEAEDGSAFVEGPTDVELGEALRWARGRARIVLVRVDDEIYSAGEDRSDPSLPAWPPPEFFQAPRPVGAPVEVRPGKAVPWLLRSVISCGPGTGAARRWAESLQDNLDVDEIRSVSVAAASAALSTWCRRKVVWARPLRGIGQLKMRSGSTTGGWVMAIGLSCSARQSSACLRLIDRSDVLGDRAGRSPRSVADRTRGADPAWGYSLGAVSSRARVVPWAFPRSVR